MRIGVISSTVFPCPPVGYAGLEMIAYHTSRGLGQLGHSCCLIAPDGSSCEGCDVHHFGPPGAIDERAAFDRYWKILSQFDVIIDHSWQKWAYGLKREGVLKCPILGVLHAPVNTMFTEHRPPPVERPCVVCISEDQASHYRAIMNADCRVCHNGVESDYYSPMSIARSDRFLFLGRFSTIKGADLAIEACLRAGVGLDLVGDTTITGEPDYLAGCRRLARCRSTGWGDSRGEQITLHGGCSRGRCVWWFSQARALLHPVERFREPFGLAPVEAMMCGCPVIAWDNGAMRETITDADSGVLVRSMDDMVRAIRDYSGGRPPDSAARCRQAALRFGIDTMARRYAELCEEAVRTGGW